MTPRAHRIAAQRGQHQSQISPELGHSREPDGSPQ